MVPKEFTAVTIEQLNGCTCRWPLWDHYLPKSPPVEFALYCGAAPLPDLPYCKHHTQLARRFPEKG
jgi:hypothetical protein